MGHHQCRSMCGKHALLRLALLLSTAFCAAAETTPLVLTTSGSFNGIDGAWSEVQLRVGSPEQYLSLLPSTLSSETWVVGVDGCDGTSVCTSERGGLFAANESSSFNPQAVYELGTEPQQPGFGQYGYYGSDTIALDDGTSVSDQVVAVINTTSIWNGNMGLGVENLRFTGDQEILPLLSSLVKHGRTPSHSYGYTAGASYRLKGVPASLILGGVDRSRFTPNDLLISLATGYQPVVAINSMTVSDGINDLPSNWNTNPLPLMDKSDAATFTIDTSTPFLSLPASVCDNFAQALNLTYNDTLQLYMFQENASPSVLDTWNLTFTFSIANLPGSGDSVDLIIPYDAFNLQLSYPYPDLDASYASAPTNYFPLRRAGNDSQYTIGRAFLQETYLQVDYERNNFQLFQAVFTEEAVNKMNLVAITRPSNSIFDGPKSSGLSTGTEAGIGVGVGLVVLAVIGLVWYMIYRRNISRSKGGKLGSDDGNPKQRSLFARLTGLPRSVATVSELLGDKRHPTEIAADSANTRFELPGNAPMEMPAETVSSTYYQPRATEIGSSTMLRNDPKTPVEVPHRHSRNKSGVALAEARASACMEEREGSPVPPYSPLPINQRMREEVSPSSKHRDNAYGTMSSGEEGVSPVNNSSRDGSNGFASPISPEATASRFHRGHSEPDTATSTSGNGSYGSRLTPQLPGRMPSRSPSSRSSRFREEGLDSPCSEQTSRPSESRSTRFSWED